MICIWTEMPQLMAPHLTLPGLPGMSHVLRTQMPAGAPIFLAPRLQQFNPVTSLATSSMMTGPPPTMMGISNAPPALVSPNDHGIVYQIDHNGYMQQMPQMFEYPATFEHSTAGMSVTFVTASLCLKIIICELFHGVVDKAHDICRCVQVLCRR